MSNKPTKDCHHLLDCLCDYLDGDMPDALRVELEAHIEHCDRCRVVVDTTRKTISLYHQHAEDQNAPGQVVERLYRTLNLDDYLPER
jgi:anti-sigma factor RsiW